MAKPNILKELEEQYGDLTVVIPAKVAAAGHNAKAVAKELGVTDSTISKFMRDLGYVYRRTWVKDDTK